MFYNLLFCFEVPPPQTGSLDRKCLFCCQDSIVECGLAHRQTL
uniref:Uncharacterized protein n=1 Tax=Anguilla anguilla TaxID=7936 RepID=A0A0E9VH45_ANGAN